MTKYEIVTDLLGNESIIKIDKSGKVLWIPKDSANLDYQEYLASLDDA